MADPFVAEIRMFGFIFAPTGWAFCNGQIMPISQNTALFSLLGTTYGGNGESTFALPNLEGSAAMHWGQGQGLSLRDLGETGGAQFVTLLQSEIPIHTHTLSASAAAATDRVPNTAYVAVPENDLPIYGPATSPTTMSAQALPAAGGSLPHNNMQPYLVLNFCIALQGVFPPRN